MTKIMIVDDARLMRNLIRKSILENFENMHIIEAQDGSQAVEKYRTEYPDLMTLDITMEEKNGLDAAREILDMDKFARIIMITSLGQERLLEACIGMGVRDFIVKPFTKNRITESVSNALKG